MGVREARVAEGAAGEHRVSPVGRPGSSNAGVDVAASSARVDQTDAPGALGRKGRGRARAVDGQVLDVVVADDAPARAQREEEHPRAEARS